MAGLLKILVTAKAVLMVDVLLQKLKEMLYHHLSHLLLVNTSAWQGLDLAVEAPNKWNRNNHMKNKNKNTCIVRQKVIMLPIMANYNQSLPQYTILNSNNRCNNKWDFQVHPLSIPQHQLNLQEMLIRFHPQQMCMHLANQCRTASILKCTKDPWDRIRVVHWMQLKLITRSNNLETQIPHKASSRSLAVVEVYMDINIRLFLE